MKSIKSMIPKNAKKIALRPLALGEKTGHHHSLYSDGSVAVEDVCEMFEVEIAENVKTHYLRVTADGISLQHQEHKTQAVPPGEYEIVIQSEVTDWGQRPVVD